MNEATHRGLPHCVASVTQSAPVAKSVLVTAVSVHGGAVVVPQVLHCSRIHYLYTYNLCLLQQRLA